MATLLAASFATPACADEIATAKRKDGTTIRLTDEMLPACNQESLHGAARIERGKTVQQACWGFDWKKRVFSVIPLAPRSMTQGMVKGVMRLLDGERAAAWREMRPQQALDEAHALRMRADEFAWKAKPPG
ncbi:hypothetical protein LK996_09730 [Lysobacter sp. A6]|uniref:Uncharacterized protein n=1 Tax=Noviluteimonas lactosilytica TaxID=2888523 RepID=A0ABS8JIC1_9GAMM|nr:hypothetical protein [Lysobacter lactosilyticus]MCC8363350.1 hypothetical protein [Lysobacter lactosilyticus]